jgi:TPR repeat protein
VLALALAAALALTSVPDAPAPSACAFYRGIYPSAPEPAGGERGCAAALEEACESGRRLACHELARVLEAGVEGEPEPARALALYSRACGAGVADACEGAAELRDRRGDREAARAALEEGCAIGSARACARLAAEAGSPARAAAARRARVRSRGAGRMHCARPRGDPAAAGRAPVPRLPARRGRGLRGERAA